MRHFTSFFDFTPDELGALSKRALDLKQGAASQALRGKVLGMIFLNPSLRTRVSFESAMARFGGTAISLSAGGDMWSLETRDGAVMNGASVEHVKDAARVLSRYCDAIAIRTFGTLKNLDEDMREDLLSGLIRYSTVPVISMESASEHPCQALADITTIQEKLGDPRGKKFVLTWAPHIKPLPLAVPHSALLTGGTLGMNVTLACPKGYEPHEKYLSKTEALCRAAGTNFEIVHDQDSLDDADVVYLKAWGNPSLYGDLESQKQELEKYSSWMVKGDTLPSSSILMHCLPVRRNVEVSESALDSSQSVTIDQAENRLWAQASVLEALWSGGVLE